MGVPSFSENVVIRPVFKCSSFAMPVVFMPSWRNVSRIDFPKISLPIVPEREAFAPARTAAMAWIEALPPIWAVLSGRA